MRQSQEASKSSKLCDGKRLKDEEEKNNIEVVINDETVCWVKCCELNPVAMVWSESTEQVWRWGGSARLELSVVFPYGVMGLIHGETSVITSGRAIWPILVLVL